MTTQRQSAPATARQLKLINKLVAQLFGEKTDPEAVYDEYVKPPVDMQKIIDDNEIVLNGYTNMTAFAASGFIQHLIEKQANERIATAKQINYLEKLCRRARQAMSEGWVEDKFLLPALARHLHSELEVEGDIKMKVASDWIKNLKDNLGDTGREWERNWRNSHKRACYD